MKKLLLILLLLTITSCFDKPEISVRQLSIDGIDGGSIKIRVVTDVKNVNGFDVTLAKTELRILKDGVQAGSSLWEGQELLESRVTKQIPVIINLDQSVVSGLLLSYLKGTVNDELSKFAVEINAEVSKLGISKTISFKGKYKDIVKGDKKVLPPDSGGSRI